MEACNKYSNLNHKVSPALFLEIHGGKNEVESNTSIIGLFIVCAFIYLHVLHLFGLLVRQFVRKMINLAVSIFVSLYFCHGWFCLFACLSVFVRLLVYLLLVCLFPATLFVCRMKTFAFLILLKQWL